MAFCASLWTYTLSLNGFMNEMGWKELVCGGNTPAPAAPVQLLARFYLQTRAACRTLSCARAAACNTLWWTVRPARCARTQPATLPLQLAMHAQAAARRAGATGVHQKLGSAHQAIQQTPRQNQAWNTAWRGIVAGADLQQGTACSSCPTECCIDGAQSLHSGDVCAGPSCAGAATPLQQTPRWRPWPPPAADSL